MPTETVVYEPKDKRPGDKGTTVLYPPDVYCYADALRWLASGLASGDLPPADWAIATITTAEKESDSNHTVF